jgi:hypothetical protein
MKYRNLVHKWNPNYMNRFLKLLSLFLISLPLQAQELLTVEEAVKIALENNYQIRVAQNELEIDQYRCNHWKCRHASYSRSGSN